VTQLKDASVTFGATIGDTTHIYVVSASGGPISN
jgi:hypothetical protein